LVPMTFTQRLAAAVMLTLGGLALWFVFTLFSSTSSVAFADVADKLKAARTLTYQTTTTLAGKPPMTTKTLVAEPDRMRLEMAGGVATIQAGGRAIVLNPLDHTARRLDFANALGPQANMVEAMRNLGNIPGEALGGKAIDGIVAVGFRVNVGNRPMNVWADKKTALPLRVEMTFPMGGADATVVMDHFEIDPPLDDSLFSLDPPPGYTLSTLKIEIPKLGKVEEEVSALLKDQAELSGGVFPPSLTDWASLGLAAKDAGKDAQMKLATRVGAISGMLFSLPDGYGYAGKDVKLGEKEKLVFWYREDKTSNTYHAVFGDLRMADVTADKLPSTEKQPATMPSR